MADIWGGSWGTPSAWGTSWAARTTPPAPVTGLVRRFAVEVNRQTRREAEVARSRRFTVEVT